MKRHNLILIALLGLLICASGVSAKGIVGQSVASDQAIQQDPGPPMICAPAQAPAPDSGTNPEEPRCGVIPVPPPPPPPPPDPGTGGYDWDPQVWMSIWIMLPKVF